MQLLFDYDPQTPQLIFRFDKMSDLVSFLVGFWETLDDE